MVADTYPHSTRKSDGAAIKVAVFDTFNGPSGRVAPGSLLTDDRPLF